MAMGVTSANENIIYNCIIKHSRFHHLYECLLACIHSIFKSSGYYGCHKIAMNHIQIYIYIYIYIYITRFREILIVKSKSLALQTSTT